MSRKNAGTIGEAVVGLGHIGITVKDVDKALRFWKAFLDVDPIWRRAMDGDYLAEITGYEDVELDVAVIDICGIGRLEFLDYQRHARPPGSMETSKPGNVHICFQVTDVNRMRERAISSGAKPVSRSAVEVSSGPNAGAVACYLKIHDDVTLELVEAP